MYVGLYKFIQIFDDLCDTRVNKRYMNEPTPHSNESDPEDKEIKKCFKKFKITIYTNKVHYFLWLNHRNFIVKHALLNDIE